MRVRRECPARCAPHLLFVLPKRRRSAPGPEEKGANAMNLCTALGLGIAIVGTSYSSGARSIADHNAVRAKASLTLAALPALRSLHNAAPARRASNVRHTRLGRDARLNFCTRQRQAKRLRAETGATALSTVAPRQSDSCGHDVAFCKDDTRISALFSLESKNRFSFRASTEKRNGS